MSNDAFPLGVPVNRRHASDLVPVPGRPGWWKHRLTGVEQYIEPPRPTEPEIDLLIYGYYGPAVEVPEDDEPLYPQCESDE